MSHTADMLRLQESLKELNLSYMAQQIEPHLRQAREAGLDYGAFLLGSSADSAEEAKKREN